MAVMDIESQSPLSGDGPHATCARPCSNSYVNTLDRQGLQIGRGIFGIEHLAVEEGLLAARGRGRDVGDAKLLRRVFPEILAVDLSDQRLGVEVRFVLAPADVLGQEPEIVAPERLGCLVAPEP